MTLCTNVTCHENHAQCVETTSHWTQCDLVVQIGQQIEHSMALPNVSLSNVWDFIRDFTAVYGNQVRTKFWMTYEKYFHVLLSPWLWELGYARVFTYKWRSVSYWTQNQFPFSDYWLHSRRANHRTLFWKTLFLLLWLNCQIVRLHKQ